MTVRPGLLIRTALVALAAMSIASTPAQATYTTSTSPALDHPSTDRLHAVADAARAGAGRESFFARTAYANAATKAAVAAVQGQSVPFPTDGAPMAYYSGVTSPSFYDMYVESAIQSVVAQAHAVVVYPLHTDAGWAVVSKSLGGGLIAYGVALVVGWPDPAVATGTGCSAYGYCWANRGLNPHLPWTRNVVKVYLSTSHLPAAGESLLKSALGRLNAIPGVGADIRYGGKVSDTAPTSAHRFVVLWGSCGTASALACTTTSTQGTYHLIYQAKTIVSSARYAANTSSTWWVGTLMHEVLHAVGLGHFDGTYLGSYQLMRWANGPDLVKAGDANGYKRLAPAGKPTGTLRRVGTTLVVRAGSSGLGGVRSIRTQCTDAAGAYHPVATVSGLYDIRASDRSVGSYSAPAGTTRRCRAVVTSKAASYPTPSIVVSG